MDPIRIRRSIVAGRRRVEDRRAMPTPPIRVLLVDMPRLLRDLIEHAIAAQPGLRVVGAEADVDALGRATRETDAEFVIVGLEHGELPSSAQAFLDERTRAKVLGVEAEDGSAVLYELKPRRVPIGRVTPDELAAAIRDAAVVHT
jgi:DNA-binding NarL/FixJ family response regulator